MFKKVNSFIFHIGFKTNTKKKKNNNNNKYSSTTPTFNEVNKMNTKWLRIQNNRNVGREQIKK